MTEEQQTPYFFTEAPASATVKVVSDAGYEWLVTSRANTTAEMLDRLQIVEDWLQKHNWQPAAGRYQAAPQSTNGNGPQAEPNPDVPVCPYHGAMKPSKFGGFYCSARMGDGSYCQEKRA